MKNTLNNQKQNYFKISVKGGHMGNGRYADMSFYVIASDIFSAMKKAKKFPSVKHNKLPISAKMITEDEYNKNKNYNAYSRCAYRNN